MEAEKSSAGKGSGGDGTRQLRTRGQQPAVFTGRSKQDDLKYWLDSVPLVCAQEVKKKLLILLNRWIL